MGSRIKFRTRSNINKRFQRRLKTRSAIVGDPRTGSAQAMLANWANVNINGITGAVRNLNVTNVGGQLVRIGRDPAFPTYAQILGTWFQGGAVGGSFPVNVLPHGQSHRWMGTNGGNDVTMIELRQLVPLRVGLIPEVDFSVRVQRGHAIVGSTAYRIDQTDIDLTAYIPTEADQARYVLVYVNNIGALATLAGIIQPADNLTLEHIPIPGGAYKALAGVQLYHGQPKLRESRSQTDFTDLRFADSATGTISNQALRLVAALENEMDFRISQVWVQFYPRITEFISILGYEIDITQTMHIVGG